MKRIVLTYLIVIVTLFSGHAKAPLSTYNHIIDIASSQSFSGPPTSGSVLYDAKTGVNIAFENGFVFDGSGGNILTAARNEQLSFVDLDITSIGMVWWKNNAAETRTITENGVNYPEYLVKNSAGILNINAIEFTNGWKIDGATLPPWMSFSTTPGCTQACTQTLSVKIAENHSVEERSGIIRLKCRFNNSEERFYITQAASTFSLAVNETGVVSSLVLEDSNIELLKLTPEPGTVELEIMDDGSTPWTVEVEKDGGWLIANTAQGTGSGTIHLQHYYDPGKTEIAVIHIYTDGNLAKTYHLEKLRQTVGNRFSDQNYVVSRSYEGYGNLTGQAIQYSDANGKPTQSIAADMNRRSTITSEVLYDEYGRTQYSTMAIPLESSSMEFNDAFLNRHTDVLTQIAPDVTHGAGSYYSHTNTSEAYVPDDAQPYSWVEYSHVIPGAVSASHAPGEIMSTKTAHSYKVSASSDELMKLGLSGKINLKTLEPGASTADDFMGMTKAVSQDVMGKESITYYDSDGNAIVSCMSGEAIAAAKRKPALYKLPTGNNVEAYMDIHLPNNLPTGETTYEVTLYGDWQYKIINLINETSSTGSFTSAKVVYLNPGFYRIICNGVDTNHAAYASVDIAYKYHSFNAYDKAGRLVRSLSPLHAEKLEASTEVTEELVNSYTSRFTYNSLGWLLSSYSPDEGTSTFQYCKDGRIRFSQNAEQARENATEGKVATFSYTNYDKLKRIVEVGESSEITVFNSPGSNKENAVLNPAYCSSQTFTEYSTSETLLGRTQQFTRGRVSKSWNANTCTWYSYNYDGSIAWAIQEYTGLDLDNDSISNTETTSDPDDLLTLDYSYNFDGSISQVTYQDGQPDAFTHRYFYDLNKRLYAVYTLAAGDAEYTLQAKYEYYPHGPLKRMELGDNLQGVDFVYTINGLLKRINNSEGNDPGDDVNDDLFALGLEYYQNDYVRSGTGITSEATAANYDGNIALQHWKNNALGTDAFGFEHAAYRYNYDERNYLGSAQLGNYAGNSLSAMDMRYGLGTNYNYTDKIFNSIAYDANGNIRSMSRFASCPYPMDALSYSYASTPALNQLTQVTEGIVSCDATGDMETNAYTYNAIGQLVSDTYGYAGTAHRFSYDVYGKVSSIVNANNASDRIVDYSYSNHGFRIKKDNHKSSQTTWYARDLNGNILATYSTQSGTTTLQEQPLYGSGRIGLVNRSPGANEYVYELSDHLGNVRCTFADNNADGSPEVLTATDYYPMGMPMPGRIFGTGYRFGYQGQFAEEDDENGYNQFEARLYDNRTGRWLIPDPAGQYWSPYLGMGNNWPNGIDPDGEWVNGEGFWRNLFRSDSRIHAENMAAEANLCTGANNYTAMKNAGVWGVSYKPNSLISLPNGGSISYSSFTAVTADGGVGSTLGGYALVSFPVGGRLEPSIIDDVLEIALTGGVSLVSKQLPKASLKLAAKTSSKAFTYTKSAGKHLDDIVSKGVNKGQMSRPYMKSPLTVKEIMSTGKGMPDATFKGGMNWKVPGTFRGSQGVWELGINPNTNVIYHFNFVH